MDVLCPQCASAYELDDALLTSAGTLVRCTKCEHKFRVAGTAADEPWVVQTFDGGSARFRSLADVQQAIVRGELGRSDILQRGRGPARPLGSIVELNGFFEEQARLSGLSRDNIGSVPDDIPTSPNLASVSSVHVVESLPDISSALTSHSNSGVLASPFARTPSSVPPPLSASPPWGVAGTLPPPPPPAMPGQVLVTGDPASVRSYVGPTPLSSALPSDPPRSAAPIDIRPKARATGWIVAASLLVAVGSGAFLLGRRYTRAPAPEASSEGQSFDFDRAVADLRSGRIDRAREAADSMSKVMGADERLLGLRADIAVASADVAASMSAIAQKLQLGDAPQLALAAEESASQAMKAAERAAESMPEAPATVERLAQACSLSASRARARQFADRLGGDESAHRYVRALMASVEGREDRLALLEKAFESEPFRARLRALAEHVAAGEPAAQGALVASLRASSDSAAFLRWLDTLPLTPAAAADAGADPAPRAKAADSDDFGAPFEGADREGTGVGTAGSKAGKKLTSDPRKALEEGERARRRGDVDLAKALFQVALEANPLDSEALAGLGDCARDAREGAVAIGYYRKALSANPSYLPARLGLADSQWASGDRASAAKGYREIMENFPEGAYPTSVKERALGRAPTGEEP
jgi:predicted Zn finger-like uncharacterized protein